MKFTAPEKAFGPSTLDAPPPITSTELIDSKSKGKFKLWCPVCKSDILIPLSNIKVWSKVPPLIPKSAWAPAAPRCRKSILDCIFSTDSKFSAGIFSIAEGVISVMLLPISLYVDTYRLAFTITSFVVVVSCFIVSAENAVFAAKALAKSSSRAFLVGNKIITNQKN